VQCSGVGVGVAADWARVRVSSVWVCRRSGAWSWLLSGHVLYLSCEVVNHVAALAVELLR